MARTPFIGVLILLMGAVQIVSVGKLGLRSRASADTST